MLIKSRLKLQRQVLFEKKGHYKRTIVDVFKELTDNCKIMYDPTYKSRFFLYKNNKRLLTILTHGKNKMVIVEKWCYYYIVSRHYNLHISRSKRYEHISEVYRVIAKFVKQYGYELKYTKEVKYKIYGSSLIYLNKTDGVVLKTGYLWFAH